MTRTLRVIALHLGYPSQLQLRRQLLRHLQLRDHQVLSSFIHLTARFRNHSLEDHPARQEVQLHAQVNHLDQAQVVEMLVVQ